jgi:hypothetical protein
MYLVATTNDRWLRADFHELEDDNRLTVRVDEETANGITEGDWVVLFDSDDLNFRAYVTRRVDNLVECLIDVGRHARELQIPDFLTSYSAVQQTVIAVS